MKLKLKAFHWTIIGYVFLSGAMIFGFLRIEAIQNQIQAQSEMRIVNTCEQNNATRLLIINIFERIVAQNTEQTEAERLRSLERIEQLKDGPLAPVDCQLLLTEGENNG